MTIGIRQYSDINNIYGYEVGDSVLRSFADYLDKLIPETKRIYRVDGVKFAIILPVDMQNEIRDLFFRIKEAGEQGILAGGERIRLSVYGISIQFKHMPVSESIVFHELMHLMTDAKQSNVVFTSIILRKLLKFRKRWSWRIRSSEAFWKTVKAFICFISRRWTEMEKCLGSRACFAGA